MRKKRSEPKRFLENIRTSSVEKLEQTTRYDENVTYIKPRKVPNEGADEVGTKNPEQLLLKMLFSLREKKATLGDRKHRQLPIFGDEPSESCEDRPTLENYSRIAAYPPNSYKISRCLSMISPAYFRETW